MLEKWCHNSSDRPAIELLGALRGTPVPEELYGMLSALLFRASEMGEDIADALCAMGFRLPDAEFQLVMLSLEAPQLGPYPGKERHYCRINLYHALRDHMLDVIGEQADGFLFLQSGYLLGLLYPREGVEIAAYCRETVDYANTVLEVGVHVNISTRWHSIQNVEQAYTMLLDAEKSRQFYTDMVEQVFQIPQGTFQRIVDQDQRTRFEQTFFQTAERICGTVRAGDPGAVGQVLREQLLKIAENCIGMPYPNAMNMTVNRFLFLLQYRLVEEDLADWRFLTQRDFSRDLVSSEDLAEFLNMGDAIAAQLVEHAKQRMDQQHDTMMREMRAYVEANATDVNMGLTAVSREFRVKPRETAESFRRYFGESINDVIHKARVKKAKEMLLTTDAPVQDIAEAVGYCSLATMYRAFTNVEGVAPGKLRQNRGNK